MTVDNDLAMEQWNSHFRKLVDRNLYASRSWKALIEGGMESDTTGAARQLGVAFTTAQRATERLERSGIVQQTTDVRRNRVYCARALLDILEEPARLKPAAAE